MLFRHSLAVLQIESQSNHILITLAIPSIIFSIFHTNDHITSLDIVFPISTLNVAMYRWEVINIVYGKLY